MRQYIICRLAISIPILIGVTIITFILTELMPGDFVDAMIPPDKAVMMSPERVQAMREAYGLDKPSYMRYLLWLREVTRGNLGYSLASGEPMLKEVLKRAPFTLQLTLSALTFGVVAGVTLGIISAVKQYTWVDQLLTILGFVWISTPSFVFGIGAIALFALKLRLFPAMGGWVYGEAPSLATRLHHMVLPVAVLGLGSVATFMRYTRTSILDVIRQDYVTVARAKGFRERYILLRHTLRNALIPVITLIGLEIPWLLSGSIIIESVFVWPGIARYTLQGVHSRDYTLIMGVNLIAALTVVIANLLTDLTYAVADPRIRY